MEKSSIIGIWQDPKYSSGSLLLPNYINYVDPFDPNALFLYSWKYQEAVRCSDVLRG